MMLLSSRLSLRSRTLTLRCCILAHNGHRWRSRNGLFNLMQCNFVSLQASRVPRAEPAFLSWGQRGAGRRARRGGGQKTSASLSEPFQNTPVRPTDPCYLPHSLFPPLSTLKSIKLLTGFSEVGPYQCIHSTAVITF